MPLTADDLLAGGTLEHEIDLPAELVGGDDGVTDTRMTLRPLCVRDVQRIARAARDDQELSATLMIQLSAVDPPLTAEQAARLPAGLARRLVDEINEISGMTVPRDRLAELVQEPLAKACFVLADEFGWTAEDVSSMTIGQILLYLEMSGQSGAVA